MNFKKNYLRKSGLVHTVKATGANIHDVTMMPELLHGVVLCSVALNAAN